MANPGHLAILQQGVQTWNQWREEHDIRPDLSGANLSGANLSGVNLSGADLSGVNFSSADIRGANLSQANLSQANLNKAGLSKATLMSADLSKANLTRADLSSADIRGVTLRGATLLKTDLSGATLLKTDLSGAKLWKANLSGAGLRGVTLSGANLSGADLRGVDLSPANLSPANLSQATLMSADLSKANLSQANLAQATLSQATLMSADLNDANVSGVKYLDRKHDQNTSKWERFLTWLYPRQIMRGKYRGIRVASCFGHARFKRDAEDQDFLDTLEEQWKGTWRIGLFWAWGLIDYGRSMLAVVLIALIIVVVFGLIYFFSPDMISYGSHHKTLFSPFYFSIVTFTTLGFGDVTANGWLGEMVVSLQVILGYLTLGLLISILANKVARRS